MATTLLDIAKKISKKTGIPLDVVSVIIKEYRHQLKMEANALPVNSFFVTPSTTTGKMAFPIVKRKPTSKIDDDDPGPGVTKYPRGRRR